MPIGGCAIWIRPMKPGVGCPRPPHQRLAGRDRGLPRPEPKADRPDAPSRERLGIEHREIGGWQYGPYGLGSKSAG